MLKRIGLLALQEEVCIFVDTEYKVFVMFYVNDVQVLYHRDNELRTAKVIKSIKEVYELCDMGDVG